MRTAAAPPRRQRRLHQGGNFFRLINIGHKQRLFGNIAAAERCVAASNSDIGEATSAFFPAVLGRSSAPGRNGVRRRSTQAGAEGRAGADQAQTQQQAVSSAEPALELATNRYKGGAVGYLDVVAAHSTALTNQRVAIEISPRRLDASVLLVKAPGGVWDSPERGSILGINAASLEALISRKDALGDASSAASR